jgi:hypothetical protein
MTSATSFSSNVPVVSEQRTEELIRKIKAISSTSSNLKNSSPAGTRPSSKSSKRPTSSNRTPLQPKSPPKIQIIYSAKTDRRSPSPPSSPPPKNLVWRFPCPPEIDFPNATRIQLPKSVPVKNIFPLEDCVETATATSFSEDIKLPTDGSKMTLASSSRVPPCIVNLGVLASPTKEVVKAVAHHRTNMKAFRLSELKTCGRSRRGRGTLWTPQRATNCPRISKSLYNFSPQTRLEVNFCDSTTITVNLGRLTVSACNKGTNGEADDQTPLPRWLEKLSEQNDKGFHLESALEDRIYYSDHPRLHDKFVSEAFARFQTKISRVVRNEVDWDNLRQIWD